MLPEKSKELKGFLSEYRLDITCYREKSDTLSAQTLTSQFHNAQK